MQAAPKPRAATDIRLWKQLAQATERACIHFMFWADGIAVRHSARDDELSYNPRIDVFEPLTVITVLGSPADDFHTVTYAKIVAKWGLGDSAVTHAPLSTPPTPRSDPGPHTTGTTSGLPPDLTTVFLRHPGTWAATAYIAALAVA